MAPSIRLAVLSALAASLLAAPAAAQQAVPIDCGPADGSERLTTDGFAATFDAPVAKTYEATAAKEHTGVVGAHRDAVFAFTADFTPYTSATLEVTLDWTDVGDFDVFVVDADGNELASGTNRFEFEGPESAIVTLRHCQTFAIVARTGPGHPGSVMALDVTVDPGSTLLACADGDPAPGCAGKEAGEAPDPVSDTRTPLYLTSDGPGQVVLAAQYADETHRGHLEDERPTGGTANTFTRPVTGNPDFGPYTPFFPTFFAPLTQPTSISGPVQALAWISSTTMGPDDVLYFDLLIDGGQVQRIEVPGSVLAGSGVPTPILVTFDDFGSVTAGAHVGFQITSPRANDEPPDQLGQAEWTLYYDSVQFQSRLTLDLS